MTPRSMRGFTLVELTIVLVIVALLTGGLMIAVGVQSEQRARSETQNLLLEAREALLGYAASHSALDGHPYLPCPDTNGDGLENRAANACTASEGLLPWSTLGVAPQDAWSNRIRYRVEGSFSRSDIGFTLATAPTLRVCQDAACTATLATTLPAVLVSHGPNGLGATNASGGANAAAATAEELENTDGDTSFVLRPPQAPGPGVFDDQVVWLSPNVLFNRMVAAGKLP